MEGISRLSDLPRRPPTPPKELDTNKATTKNSIDIDLPSHYKGSGSCLGTPQESPSTSQEPATKSSKKSSKRVGFLIGPGATTPVNTSSPENPQSEPFDPLDPLSTKQRQPKSILKQSAHAASEPVINVPTSNDPTEFNRMLEDITRSLASKSISCRLDAYISLNGCLKTYKTSLALDALKKKTPLLADFIQRDLSLSRSTKDDGVRNMQLVLEVLRLVTTLIWSPMTTDIFPLTLEAFIMEQAIGTIGWEGASKQVVNQTLYLLSLQTFRPAVMTTERVNRLISHLKTVTERINGKQVTAHRLAIYRRLLSQARNTMLSRIDFWIDNMFHGMMAETKEIRVRAISLGFEAADKLSSEPAMSRAVKDCFNYEATFNGVEARYGDVFLARLTQWLESREDARLIPQIWSVLILLIRQPPRNIEKWTFIVPLLRLIQKCFNSSDTELKLQANRAWTRLIYAVSPDQKTGNSMVSLIRDPITGQLQRTKALEESKKLRASTYSVYYTLLYYTFRPGLDSATLCRHWDAYFSHVLASMKDARDLDVGMFSGVLTALFGSNPPKTWLSNRAFLPEQIKCDEIPRLDAKWVRSNCTVVLRLIESLLPLENWWLSSDGVAPIVKVWQSFTKTIKQAGSKEIKISMEAMRAMADVTGMINRYYISSRKTSPGDGERQRNIISRTSILIQTAAETLGSHIFSEKRLVKSSADSYLAAETPSSRSPKPSGDMLSPVGHLVRFITSQASVSLVPADYHTLLSTVFSIGLQPVTSRKSKLRALREAMHNLPDEENVPKITAWDVVARQLDRIITIKAPEESSSEGVYQVGQDFREATKILEAGARFKSPEVLASWNQALNRVHDQLQSEAGVAGPVVALIEPMSIILNDYLATAWSDNILPMSCFLLDISRWPASEEVVEKSHRALWGQGMVHAHKVPTVGFFDRLSSLLSDLLSKLFAESENLSQFELGELLEKLLHFSKSCPSASYLVLLKAMQGGFASLLEDKRCVLNTKTAESKKVFKLAYMLWSSVLDRLEGNGELKPVNLFKVQKSLSAGLASRHRLFANKTIAVWNSTLGLAEGLNCHDELRAALLNLSGTTEMLLNGKPVDSSSSDLVPIAYHATPAQIEEIDQEEKEKVIGNTLSKEPVLEKIDANDVSPMPAVQRTPRRQQQSSRQSTPKLRHDDSQIQFEVIDSSPSKIEFHLLTEHQREVKERQEREGHAMFADLRSSTKSKDQNKGSSQPRLQLRSEPLIEHSDADDLQSPMLPGQGGIDFLGSSPTPSQRRSSSKDKSSSRPPSSARNDEHQAARLSPDLPSSPPMMPKRAKDLSGKRKQGTDDDIISSEPVEPRSTSASVVAGKKRARSSSIALSDDSLIQVSTGSFGPSELGLNEGAAIGRATRSRAPRSSKRVSPKQRKQQVTRSQNSSAQPGILEKTAANNGEDISFEPNSVEAQLFNDMAQAASQESLNTSGVSTRSKLRSTGGDYALALERKGKENNRSRRYSKRQKANGAMAREVESKAGEEDTVHSGDTTFEECNEANEEIGDSIVLAKSQLPECGPSVAKERTLALIEDDDNTKTNDNDDVGGGTQEPPQPPTNPAPSKKRKRSATADSEHRREKLRLIMRLAREMEDMDQGESGNEASEGTRDTASSSETGAEGEQIYDGFVELRDRIASGGGGDGGGVGVWKDKIVAVLVDIGRVLAHGATGRAGVTEKERASAPKR